MPSEIPPSYEIPAKTLEKLRRIFSKDVSQEASIFKVLSDPLRLKILRVLKEESVCVCVLIELSNIQYSALSYHLKLLKDANLIDFERKGKFLIYYLTDFGRRMVEILELISHN
ncbi:MAG: metalloregulator ArsR/SmtB family transcription factor [Canidatus Methanoxibalbensis ujae]|nr:metalloregulator ArsR/SmtB family transcription factor [Candidatus Methanoxibalbensis ujae]